MKRLCPAAVLALCCTLANAQQPLTGWPASYMKDLPPDYLERQRASLEAGTSRLGRLDFSTSQGTDSIGWVRYGMPALILGQRVDEINGSSSRTSSSCRPTPSSGSASSASATCGCTG